MIKIETVKPVADTTEEKTVDTIKGAVAYCDGGCVPNPGFIGYGSHAYVYEINSKVKPTKGDGWTITDRGYTRTLTKETPVAPIEYVDIVGSSIEQETNNRAEVRAILRTIKHFMSSKVSTLRIFTDSNYSCKGINEWLSGWTSNNFIKSDGTTVTNSDLWRELDESLREIRDSGTKVYVEWIKAHNGNLGNEKADSLATVGINMSKRGLDQEIKERSVAKNYWKVTQERHPYLAHKRIYFNSIKDYNEPGSYYVANPGVNDLVIGKRLPEASYSVVRLKEPDVFVELSIKRQCSLTNGYNGIFLLKLDSLFHKNVMRFIDSYGTDALSKVPRSYNMNFVDNTPITSELNPTGLSLRAIDNFNLLEELLDKYQANTDSSKEDIKDIYDTEYIDVTDKFFETVTNKKGKEVFQLKSSIDSSVKTMKISATRNTKKIKVPVSLGQDLLPRNSLKKLEGHNPKIVMSLWSESKKTVRYNFIIESDLGIGIWSNFYSDNIVL